MWTSIFAILVPAVAYFFKRLAAKEERHSKAIDYMGKVDREFINNVALRQKYADHLKERLDRLEKDFGVKPNK